MSYSGKKVNEIFSTKEYAKFKLIKGNRVIKNPKIKKLVKSMTEDGWLPGSYVVVNSRWEIIDGQHRILAGMQCNLPIIYTMEKKADDKVMRGLNKAGDNWQLNDHLHGFVEDGNEHYTFLYNFMKDFPELKITEAMMLCKNAYTAVPRGTFENGEFTVKNKRVAIEWAEYVMRLKPFAKFFNTGIFVRALVCCLTKEGFDFNDFVRKIELRPTSLVKCGTREQYIELFESIYNYRRSDKLNLRY
jgi:hypothetical protein